MEPKNRNWRSNVALEVPFFWFSLSARPSAGAGLIIHENACRPGPVRHFDVDVKCRPFSLML